MNLLKRPRKGLIITRKLASENYFVWPTVINLWKAKMEEEAKKAAETAEKVAQEEKSQIREEL